jgi:uncharacterized protein with NRDE domain
VCTITALPRSALLRTLSDEPLLLRVACNRDEQQTRPAGLPPTLRTAGARSVVMPIDPHSGGTWIAANDTGIVFAILNLNPGLPVASGDISRGTIIPALVDAATVSEALQRARRLQARRYRPFRLLLFDRYQLVECWPDNDRIRHRRSFLYAPMMRTSSGLGDAIVIGPRRRLFRTAFSAAIDPREAQDRFHRHQWPGRAHISVNMERADARTVSCTVVEVGLQSVSISYRPTDSAQAIVLRVAA